MIASHLTGFAEIAGLSKLTPTRARSLSTIPTLLGSDDDRNGGVK